MAAKQLGSAMRSSGTMSLTSKALPLGGDVSNDWLCGFGLALAELNRHYENSTAVNEVMHDAGVTPDDLSKAGLDVYDLKEIKKCWRKRK